ncbi:MAG: GNAT family N-acetyltransferase [Oscillospiraceae bacterium]|jgi:GNAT superfamily N-acetyltransferase|nr:GNAT family N-acetyltransferase [Oscillospiraceae bacterium]
MTEPRIRKCRAEDGAELSRLFMTVFGADEQGWRAFADAWLRRTDTAHERADIVALEHGSAIAGAAYLLPVGDMVLQNASREKCAMVYALAVFPEYRGLGLGARLSRECVRRGRDNGFGAVVLRPAEPELFEFYERFGGYRAMFSRKKWNVSRDELPRSESRLISESPERYRAEREARLRGTAHIDFDERALRFQMGRGGLYALPNIGAAAVERRDGAAYITELLCAPAARGAFLASIANEYTECEFIINAPGDNADTIDKFAMAVSETDWECGWYGFDFD